MNHTMKRFLNTGCIQSKTITKLFDVIMNRGLELFNNKEIPVTLTALDTGSNQHIITKHNKRGRDLK